MANDPPADYKLLRKYKSPSKIIEMNLIYYDVEA